MAGDRVDFSAVGCLIGESAPTVPCGPFGPACQHEVRMRIFLLEDGEVATELLHRHDDVAAGQAPDDGPSRQDPLGSSASPSNSPAAAASSPKA